MNEQQRALSLVGVVWLVEEDYNNNNSGSIVLSSSILIIHLVVLFMPSALLFTISLSLFEISERIPPLFGFKITIPIRLIAQNITSSASQLF